MAHKLPDKMRAVVLGKAEGKPGKVWHPVSVKQVPTPKLEDGEQGDHVIVQLHAGALNHREVFIRQSLYPGIQFDSILGADGAGVVVAPSSHKLYKKPVLLSSHENWHSSPNGPDGKKEFGILGGARQTGGRGTLAEYIKMSAEDVVPCPAHLLEGPDGWAKAAALPLAALTAYRAVFTKAEVKSGQNVLITGIGGGVAIQASHYCVALGANVYVTSGQPAKIERAIKMGAKKGFNYKDKDWAKQLASALPKDRPYLDAVVDSAGGNIATQLLKILGYGAKIAVYGQTTMKPHSLGMGEILKNVEIRGSTMGSLKEFKEAVAFIDKHKIVPVVHKVYKGLDKADQAIKDLESGDQFGKIVITTSSDSGRQSKL